jgi:hypothetical protein
MQAAVRRIAQHDGIVEANREHERRDVVITIGPLAAHFEKQVHLRRRPDHDLIQVAQQMHGTGANLRRAGALRRGEHPGVARDSERRHPGASLKRVEVYLMFRNRVKTYKMQAKKELKPAHGKRRLTGSRGVLSRSFAQQSPRPFSSNPAEVSQNAASSRSPREIAKSVRTKRIAVFLLGPGGYNWRRKVLSILRKDRQSPAIC